MAMNLGVKTPKLYFVSTTSSEYPITNKDYENGFDENGIWVSSSTHPQESQYLDLGILTDEREELSVGGVAYSLPGTGAQDRVFWAVGGKILRITISGIIPDGYYIPTYTDTLFGNGTTDNPYMSNSSVFRYKLNRILAYQRINYNILSPHVVRYRRRYIYEKDTGETGDIARWVITSYSFNFMNGTRHLQYSLTLDLSNNLNLDASDGIHPRPFGDIL